IQIAFSMALGEFLEIPTRLQEKAIEGVGHAATAAATMRKGEADAAVAPADKGAHLVRLLRSLYDLGRAGFDAKGTLLGATAIVRLFNPIVLATIFVSVVAGTMLVVVAVVGLLLRIL